MVGNGATDDYTDGNALIGFQHGMGLISDQLFEVFASSCSSLLLESFDMFQLIVA